MNCFRSIRLAMVAFSDDRLGRQRFVFVSRGELIINGKKASAETYTKYKNFLDKHKSFNIKKDEDDFNINIDKHRD